MKGNTDTCHFITSTVEIHPVFVGNSSIESRSCKKLLAIKIDSKLSFDDHVKYMCKTTNKKLRSSARTAPYMQTEKKKAFSSFFQFAT